MYTIIIPTYNEYRALPILLRSLEEVSRSVGIIFSIIVVDDNSDDGTVGFVKSFTSDRLRIRLIERNVRGLSSAILRGLGEADTEFVLVIDADLSHPPESVVAMFEMLAYADLVIGTRRVLGGGVEEWPLLRRAMSRAGELCSRSLGILVSDPMSGFFALRKSVLESVQIHPRGYKVLLDILVKANRYMRIGEVPYIFRNRNVGDSKLSLRVIYEFVVQIILLKYWQWFLSSRRR
jgi:dolichol-phosphate mannosyltransferase